MRRTGPEIPSHLLPRTRGGRIAVSLFLGLLLLAEPPIVFAVANRIQPSLLGVPFLYGWLSLVYLALVVTLIVAWLKGL